MYIVFLGCQLPTASTTLKRLAAASTTIEVGMQASVPADVVPEYDEEATDKEAEARKIYTMLKERVITTVDTGTFTEILRNASDELGANVTASTEVTTVYVGEVEIAYQPTQSPSLALGDAQANSSSSSPLVAIFSGVGGLIVLLLALCSYYFCYYQPYREEKQQDSDGSVPIDKTVYLIASDDATSVEVAEVTLTYDDATPTTMQRSGPSDSFFQSNPFHHSPVLQSNSMSTSVEGEVALTVEDEGDVEGVEEQGGVGEGDEEQGGVGVGEEEEEEEDTMGGRTIF